MIPVTIILGFLAFLFQGLALHALMGPPAGVDVLLVFFFWQACASLLTTIFYAVLWPEFFSLPGRASLLHVFLTCQFLPVAGALLFLTEMAVHRFLKPLPDHGYLGAADTPEFNHHLLTRITHGVGSRLLAKLTTTEAPLASKLSAVVTLRSMPLRYSGQMLSDLLADSNDEVRLLAYGTMDGAEKEVMKQIYEIHHQLASLPAGQPPVQLWMRMAELYWELIYQNLVTGEVRQHTLTQIAHFAHQVLDRSPEEAEMWFLLGRCALLHRDYGTAENHFLHAQRLNYPQDRLLPWLAEVAFLKGELHRIPYLLSGLRNSARMPQLQPLLRYWLP